MHLDVGAGAVKPKFISIRITLLNSSVCLLELEFKYIVIHIDVSLVSDAYHSHNSWALQCWKVGVLRLYVLTVRFQEWRICLLDVGWCRNELVCINALVLVA